VLRVLRIHPVTQPETMREAHDREVALEAILGCSIGAVVTHGAAYVAGAAASGLFLCYLMARCRAPEDADPGPHVRPEDRDAAARGEPVARRAAA